MLKGIEDGIVDILRDLIKLNSSSTRSQIFTPNKEGGHGLVKPGTIYHTMKIIFLSALISDEEHVRKTARNTPSVHGERESNTTSRTQKRE